MAKYFCATPSLPFPSLRPPGPSCCPVTLHPALLWRPTVWGVLCGTGCNWSKAGPLPAGQRGTGSLYTCAYCYVGGFDDAVGTQWARTWALQKRWPWEETPSPWQSLHSLRSISLATGSLPHQNSQVFQIRENQRNTIWHQWASCFAHQVC